MEFFVEGGEKVFPSVGVAEADVAEAVAGVEDAYYSCGACAGEAGFDD